MANHAELGREAYRSGQYSQAAAHLEHAVAAAPDDATLRLMWARSLERIGDTALAAQQFRHVAAEAGEASLVAMAQASLAKLVGPQREALAFLLRSGRLTEAQAEEVLAQRGAQETPLSAVLRLGSLRLDDLIAARFGPSGLTHLPERPFSERLGARLFAAKHISQFQLKQALMAQAQDERAIGELLREATGVSLEVVGRALRAQAPVLPVWSRHDQLFAILLRWGVLDAAKARTVQAAGSHAANLLLQRKWAQRAHLERVKAFLENKAKLIGQRRFRLGEVLVAHGALQRDELARLLACQVDQPFPLGELLILHRVCTPEVVLTGLADQQHRYDVEAEKDLPPLPDPLPEIEPPEAIEPEPKPRLDRRRVAALSAGVLLVVSYAAWYGSRFGPADYGWFNLFRRDRARSPGSPLPSRLPYLSEAATSSGVGGPLSNFDPIDAPRGAPPSAGTAAVSPLPDAALRAAQSQLPPPPNLRLVGSADPAQAPAYAPPPVPTLTPGSAWNGPVATPTPSPLTSLLGGTPQRPGLPMPDPQRPAAPGALPAAPGGRAPGNAQGLTGLPGTAGALNGRPGTLAAQGRPEGALGGARVSNATVAESGAIFRYRLGQSYFRAGQWASAQAEFQAALAADPHSVLPYYYLGRLAEARGSRQEAIQAYQRYLAGAREGEFGRDTADRLKRLLP